MQLLIHYNRLTKLFQTASYSLAQLIVGRVIGGVGNGMHTATIPMWQSECSPPHKRGMLVMVEGLLITGGICMAYWINVSARNVLNSVSHQILQFAFYWLDPSSRYGEPGELYQLQDYPSRSAAWRIPIAWQILLCLPTFITIWMPESPRWLVLRGRKDEAREVIASLDEVPVDDPEIDLKIQEIEDSLEAAQHVGIKDLFRQGKEKNFHRMTLGFVIQMFQQISGINLITYYAATLFETNIGLSALVSRIVAACNGTEYFLASFIAVWTIERFGRRNLMLFGAAGMSASMAILAGTTSDAALKPNADGEATNNAPAYVAAVFLFVFNTFFAIGWLGMTWLYPAEITPLSIRAAANGISTASNWIFNFLVVLITPVAFDSIGYRTYIIFAVINAAMFVATYFIFPETAGRSLEEMSAIFEKASVVNPYDVVLIEKRTPRRYDKQGHILRDVGHQENAFEDAQEKEKSGANLQSDDVRDASSRSSE